MFSFDHFLCTIYTFSEISMSDNSSIGIFPYSYILSMDGISLGRIFMDVPLICILCDPTHSIVVIRVKFVQTELMVEICSKSLVRAIGKVLLMTFSWNTN